MKKQEIQKIKEYVKKEAIFQNLQNNKKSAEIIKKEDLLN